MNISQENLVLILIAVAGGLLKMWRDIAILKRDVDGLADVVGTERAKARRKPIPKG